MPPRKTTRKAAPRGPVRPGARKGAATPSGGGARKGAATASGGGARKPGTPKAAAPGEQPAASPFQPGFAPECLACPFGLFFFTLRQARPEVMEHLMKAGFELFQAFKGVVDQTAERWEKAQTLQRIPIA